jgi:quinol monooxygenase YgiN
MNIFKMTEEEFEAYLNSEEFDNFCKEFEKYLEEHPEYLSQEEE